MLDLSKRSYQHTIRHQPLSSQAQLWRSAKSNKPWRLILSWVRMGGWGTKGQKCYKNFPLSKQVTDLKSVILSEDFQNLQILCIWWCTSASCLLWTVYGISERLLSLTKRPTFIWTDILWLSKTVFSNIKGYSKMQLSEWIFCRNFYLLSTYPLHHGLLDEVQSNSHWKWTNLETKFFKVYFA